MIPYDGYTKHLDLIREGVKIGAAKLYYQKSSKTYYLLVSLELEIPDITRELVNRVMGVDVGQRYLATAASADNQARFFSGAQSRHKANRYHKARTSQRAKRHPFGKTPIGGVIRTGETVYG